MTAIRCRTCQTPRPPRMCLCRNCWALLPTAAQDALNRRDNHRDGPRKHPTCTTALENTEPTE